MPFIRVSTPKDSFNIYYRTNASSSTTNCAFRPDSERPTILLVAPASFSIDFLNHQFDDPALQRYNLVAFDPPGYGKSECANLKNREQACMIDDWAMAAIMGDLCLALHISAVHVFAPMAWAAYVAPRFALLFPQMCKSITICGVSYGANWTPEYREGMNRIADRWINLADEDELEECLQNFQYIFFGETKLKDEEVERVYSNWRGAWAGKETLKSMVWAPLMLLRVELTPEQAAQMTTPTLIIHGDTMQFTTAKMAYDMAATFTSLPGHSAQVEIVKGAPYALSIISEFVPRVNALLAAQVEHVELDEPSSPTSPLQSRGPPLPPVPGVARIELDRESTMREALERLMHLAGPKLARSLALSQRDPNSVMSFSLRTPDKEALAYEKWYLPSLEAEKRAHLLETHKP